MKKTTEKRTISENNSLLIETNRNNRKRCDICSKLTIKTTERRHVNEVVLMSLSLTLNIFHPFSQYFPSISIAVFEQVNVCWKASPHRYPRRSCKLRMQHVFNMKHQWNHLDQWNPQFLFSSTRGHLVQHFNSLFTDVVYTFQDIARGNTKNYLISA